MDEITNTGLQGMQRGMEQVAQSADRVVRGFTPESAEDTSAAIVDMQSGARQVQASAAVVDTGQDIQRYILDLMA
jgi:hypothetical protein